MGGARARCPALRDSKTQGKWTSTRARGESCANRPQVVQGTCAPTGAARLCPPDALRVIRGRSSGSGETRATELPKPSAAVFAQVSLAANLPRPRAAADAHFAALPLVRSSATRSARLPSLRSAHFAPRRASPLARHFRPAGGLGRSPITPKSRSSNLASTFQGHEKERGTFAALLCFCHAPTR